MQEMPSLTRNSKCLLPLGLLVRGTTVRVHRASPPSLDSDQFMKGKVCDFLAVPILKTGSCLTFDVGRTGLRGELAQQMYGPRDFVWRT